MDSNNIIVFQKAKAACSALAATDDEKKNKVLQAVADAIDNNTNTLLQANTLDLRQMDTANPLHDRLMLTEQRLRTIASDMRHVATLPSPLMHTLCQRTLPNGLRLKKVSVPFGAIGIM